jgi:hypothetical protein
MGAFSLNFFARRTGNALNLYVEEKKRRLEVAQKLHYLPAGKRRSAFFQVYVLFTKNQPVEKKKAAKFPSPPALGPL